MRSPSLAAVQGQPGPLRKRPAAGRQPRRLAAGLGPRDAAVVREITKLHEECVTGTLAELAERYADAPPKGEIVIVVGPPAEREAQRAGRRRRASTKRSRTLSPSRAAAEVADRLGIPRKRAYARALELSR